MANRTLFTVYQNRASNTFGNVCILSPFALISKGFFIGWEALPTSTALTRIFTQGGSFRLYFLAAKPRITRCIAPIPCNSP